MSLAVLLAAIDKDGQAAAMLTVYAAASLAVALWERRPLGLVVSAAFGFFAVLAGWRYLEPQDAYAPLVLTAAGLAMVAAPQFARGRLQRWTDVLRVSGVAYLALAPVAGWVRFILLAEPEAIQTSWPADPTLLSQVTVVAAACAVAGLLRARPLCWRDVMVVAAVGLAAAGAISQLALVDAYAEFAERAAAIHLGALAFFIVVARVLESTRATPLFAGADISWDPAATRRLALAALIYAAGWALNLTFYYSLDAAGVLRPGDHAAISWAFFGLSCAEAGIAVATRWAWPDVRRHVFAVAVASSVFSLAMAADLEGQVALLLTVYAALTVVLSVWEREHLGLPLAAAYAFVAVFAARRYFGADEALVPLVLSAMGCAVFAVSVAVGRAKTWSLSTLAIAFAYAAIAPLAAWLWLAALADADGYVGDEYFLQTGLYQAGVLSLAILGGLVSAKALLERSLIIAAGSSIVLMCALLLEIAHFQPDNVQAYTVPIGLYFVGATLLASRYGRLPEELSPVMERLYGLGPTIVMAPSFIQSLDRDAWEYGLALLLESLAFLALAVIQRRVWLLTIAVSFVVASGLHYLLFEEGLPTWATLSLAGTLLMGAGTGILVGRDRWPDIQSAILAWWERRPQPA